MIWVEDCCSTQLCPRLAHSSWWLFAVPFLSFGEPLLSITLLLLQFRVFGLAHFLDFLAFRCSLVSVHCSASTVVGSRRFTPTVSVLVLSSLPAVVVWTSSAGLECSGICCGDEPLVTISTAVASGFLGYECTGVAGCRA